MSEGGALGAAWELTRTRVAAVIERVGRVASEAIEESSAPLAHGLRETVAAEERGAAMARITSIAPEKAYPEQTFIVKGGQLHPVNTADGSKWEAIGAGNSGSRWAADPENVAVGVNNSGELTERAERMVTLNFKEGTTPGTVNKLGDYRWQVDRQLDGVNRLSSQEVLDNWQNVQRVGTAQRVAREEYAEELYERKLYEALEKDGRGELDGSPEEYAQQQVAAEMAKMRALHEQDLAGGGADRIGVLPDGSWSMGDKYVNSSLGSQWKQVRADLRSYAELLSRSGEGNKLMNVRWRVG
ncbi:polymorphic toxin type 15 domain-containing protein [Nocardia aurantia]|uniref:Novel toxin 15 domain-containing protein n=1 Tax=Nocardia aurantia TaxID=2585199 RepID=A0A7K0DTR5_9NOCA|nr:polymorphic toxin type 15 domain-containing protein [Nocardia aurantia]MQY29160.1 hypothetical protein [Nocardia aurantia]